MENHILEECLTFQHSMCFLFSEVTRKFCRVKCNCYYKDEEEMYQNLEKVVEIHYQPSSTVKTHFMTLKREK
jgi:hypothetical protein